MVNTPKYHCLDCKEWKNWEDVVNKKRQMVPNLICNSCIEKRLAKTKAVKNETTSQSIANSIHGRK